MSPSKYTTQTFQKTFFSIIEWNNLDPRFLSGRFPVFKTNIFNFIRPSSNSVYNCQTLSEIGLITRLRSGLSHLKEHKLKHSFQDTLSPLRSCGNEVESSEHFFIHSPQFAYKRRTFMSTLGNSNYFLSENTRNVLIQILVFGNM